MARMVVHVQGVEQVNRNLHRMGDLAVDMRDPLQESAVVIQGGIDASFASEGPGWAPLAAATVEDRVRRGFGPGPILDRTGALRRGYQGADAVQADADELRIENAVEYARFHQTGTGNMPARRVRLDELTKRAAVRVLQRRLVEAGYGR
jgi:hypothetical protein